jgi:hypothetical protein
MTYQWFYIILTNYLTKKKIKIYHSINKIIFVVFMLKIFIITTQITLSKMKIVKNKIHKSNLLYL